MVDLLMALVRNMGEAVEWGSGEGEKACLSSLRK